MFVLQERHQQSDVSHRVNKHECLIQQITSHVPSVHSTRLWCAFFWFYTQTSFLMNNVVLTKVSLSSAFFLFLNQVIGFCVRSATCFSSALSSQVRRGPATRGRPRVHVKRTEMNEVWRWVSGEQPSQWARLMCSQQTARDPSSARLIPACGFVRRGVYLRSALTFTSLRHRWGPPRRGHRGAFIRARAHASVTHAVAEERKKKQMLPGGFIGFGSCVSNTPAVCLNSARANYGPRSICGLLSFLIRSAEPGSILIYIILLFYLSCFLELLLISSTC